MVAPARAELAVGVLDGPGNALVTFDTTAPQQFSAIRQITGLQAGEQIVGLDYRYTPIGAGATAAGLFGLGIVDAGSTDTARLYRIDQGTGAATVVSASPIVVEDGTSYGVDFNPTADRLRVVSDADDNLRINPNTGARADAPVNDTNLTPGSVDVEAVAYDRVDADPATATTLFALNSADHTLARIGGVDGIPSPNAGAVTAVAPTGVTTDPAAARNFDVSPTGAAYVTAVPTATLSPALYSVNLATGGFTQIGSLAGGVRGLAVTPQASVSFAAAQAEVTEGATATLSAVRGGATSGTATVDYQAAAGSASATDFNAAAGSLSFSPEETSKAVAIATANDTVDEPDETVIVTLSDPDSTTALGAPGAVTLTIVDDDPDAEACAKAKKKLKRAKKKLKELKADDAEQSRIEKAERKVKKLKKKVKKACR